MKKLLLIACALAVPLSACETIPSIPASPSAVTNLTKADEQVALTAELAYKSWRLAVETGVNSGLIKGQLAGHVAQLDNQLYSALQAVESAYATGNASSLAAAVASFNTTLNVGYSAIHGSN